VWFLPMLMVVTPGSGHPAPFQTAWTLAVAVLTFVLVVRTSRAISVAKVEDGVAAAPPMARAA
jgi:hypothetical protein